MGEGEGFSMICAISGQINFIAKQKLYELAASLCMSYILQLCRKLTLFQH